MKIVFHTGAHFTEEKRLFKSLLRNKQMLTGHGVAVPGPGRYRKQLRMAFNQMAEPFAPISDRDVSMDRILDGGEADRVIFSGASFIGAPKVAYEQGVLYPLAPTRAQNMQELFPDDEIELFIALRDPTTFLPRLFAESGALTTDEFFDGVDPRDIQWSETIAAIREAAPEVPITIWCNEDAPIIWPQVLRDVAGVNVDASFIGIHELMQDIMTPEGFARFKSYINARPHLSERQIQSVTGAFLERFAMAEAVEEEIDMPGWSETMIVEMSEAYDEDVQRLPAIQGVRLIAP